MTRMFFPLLILLQLQLQLPLVVSSHGQEERSTSSSRRRIESSSNLEPPGSSDPRILIPLAPFSISFQSPNLLTPVRSSSSSSSLAPRSSNGDSSSLEGPDEVQIDGALLASSLGLPLKLLVQEFLLEEYQSQLAAQSALPSSVLPELLHQLQAMQIHATVFSSATRERGNARRRNHRSRALRETQDPPAEDVVQFYAEFTGHAVYGPVPADRRPANEYVQTILAGWMETGFTTHKDRLQTLMRAQGEFVSSQILQHHTLLDIRTNIVPLGSSGKHPFLDLPVPGSMNTKRPGLGQGQVILLVCLALTATVSMGGALFLYLYYPHYYDKSVGAFPTPTNTTPKDAPSMVRNKSSSSFIRRPSCLVRSSSSRSNSLAATTMADHTVNQDDYPDDMVLPGRQPDHPTPRYESSDLQDQSLEYLPEHPDHHNYNDDEYYDDDSKFGGTASVGVWLHKISSSMQSTVRRWKEPPLECDKDPRQYPFAFSDFPRADGTPCLLYSYSESPHGGAAVLEKEWLAMGGMRVNGSSSGGGAKNDRSGAFPRPNANDTTVSATPLTDDEFQKVLSQQSHNTSLEDDDDDDCKSYTASVDYNYYYNEEDQDPNDDAPTMNHHSKGTAVAARGDEAFETQLLDPDYYPREDDYSDNYHHNTNNPKNSKTKNSALEPRFQQKLARLVSMRHKHIEKQRLVDKAKNRRKQEEEARQLKLRRHEMELDMEAIEASLSLNHPTNHNGGATSYNNGPSFPNGLPSNKAHRAIVSESDFFSTGMFHPLGDTLSHDDDDDAAHAARLLDASRPSSDNPNYVPKVMARHKNTKHNSKRNDLYQGDSGSAGLPPRRNKQQQYQHSTLHNMSQRIEEDAMTDEDDDDEERPSRSRIIRARKSNRHRRSHRRSFSHGTNLTEANQKSIEAAAAATSSSSRHGRQGSSGGEDVMTFGIAAYTNFARNDDI